MVISLERASCKHVKRGYECDLASILSVKS
jgi:hypothetical protein